MKLTAKLSLAFLIVSLIAVGLVAVLVWSTTSSEFNRYIQDQRQNTYFLTVQEYYTQNGTWTGVQRTLQAQSLIPPPRQVGQQQQPPPPPFALLDENHRVIIPGGRYQRGEQIAASSEEIPVLYKGSAVGYVIQTGEPIVKSQQEQQYVNRIALALFLAALGAMLIALLLGLWLAQTLTRPVKELTVATRGIAAGKLTQQVPVRSTDELGELAQSFNQMSADLARANQLRKQMTADIAHDLRNPLTVIGGYLESLRDQVLKPTPERFETMYAEVQHLQRLVEDLRTLSLADAGELKITRQTVHVNELLMQVASAYQHQAEQQQIALSVESDAGLTIHADPERMEQVLGNLVSNALRYTPTGGKVQLIGKAEAGRVLLGVQDTGSGIQAEALPHIFERSYRADPSRSEDGSGLGLAICKSIVELHGGSIHAKSKLGQGSLFVITIQK